MPRENTTGFDTTNEHSLATSRSEQAIMEDQDSRSGATLMNFTQFFSLYPARSEVDEDTVDDNKTCSNSSSSLVFQQEDLYRLKAALTCPLCGKLLVRNPAAVEPCGHVFCFDCINAATEKGVTEGQLQLWPWADLLRQGGSGYDEGSSVRSPRRSTRRQKKKKTRFTCPVCLGPAFKWTLVQVPLVQDLCTRLAGQMPALGETLMNVTEPVSSSDPQHTVFSVVDDDNNSEESKGSYAGGAEPLVLAAAPTSSPKVTFENDVTALTPGRAPTQYSMELFPCPTAAAENKMIAELVAIRSLPVHPPLPEAMRVAPCHTHVQSELPWSPRPDRQGAEEELNGACNRQPNAGLECGGLLGASEGSMTLPQVPPPPAVESPPPSSEKLPLALTSTAGVATPSDAEENDDRPNASEAETLLLLDDSFPRLRGGCVEKHEAELAHRVNNLAQATQAAFSVRLEDGLTGSGSVSSIWEGAGYATEVFSLPWDAQLARVVWQSCCCMKLIVREVLLPDSTCNHVVSVGTLTQPTSNSPHRFVQALTPTCCTALVLGSLCLDWTWLEHVLLSHALTSGSALTQYAASGWIGRDGQPVHEEEKNAFASLLKTPSTARPGNWMKGTHAFFCFPDEYIFSIYGALRETLRAGKLPLSDSLPTILEQVLASPISNHNAGGCSMGSWRRLVLAAGAGWCTVSCRTLQTLLLWACTRFKFADNDYVQDRRGTGEGEWLCFDWSHVPQRDTAVSLTMLYDADSLSQRLLGNTEGAASRDCSTPDEAQQRARHIRREARSLRTHIQQLLTAAAEGLAFLLKAESSSLLPVAVDVRQTSWLLQNIAECRNGPGRLARDAAVVLPPSTSGSPDRKRARHQSQSDGDAVVVRTDHVAVSHTDTLHVGVTAVRPEGNVASTPATDVGRLLSTVEGSATPVERPAPGVYRDLLYQDSPW